MSAHKLLFTNAERGLRQGEHNGTKTSNIKNY